MKLFNLNRCDSIQNVQLMDGIIISPNGAIFFIPEKTNGSMDEQNRPHGKHTAFYESDGKLFPATRSVCDFVHGELVHLIQYKKINQNMIKCLDCNIKNGNIVGDFYVVGNGEEYTGEVASDGTFTGKCMTPASEKWYMSGLRHGAQIERVVRDGGWIKIKKNYSHGYLDGEFSIHGNKFYQYWYVKEGQIIYERTVDFNDYPVLKKLNLVSVLGALMTYPERQVLKHTIQQTEEKSRYHG